MKSGLIALDPLLETDPSFEAFTQILRSLQDARILGETSVASVVHPGLYAVPSMAYPQMRGTFIKEATARVNRASSRIRPVQTRILSSDSSVKESHIYQLTRCAHRLGRDLLVLASTERRGVPYWVLGSYSETAALIAKMPVLVIKPTASGSEFSKIPHLMLAVDAASPPSSRAIRWIAGLGKPAGATVELLYIRPKQRVLIDKLQKRKSKDEAAQVLSALQSSFAKLGIAATIRIQEEEGSIAETVARRGEASRAWMTIATEAIRTKPRRLLIGSTAKKILTHARRPFLTLRMI